MKVTKFESIYVKIPQSLIENHFIIFFLLIYTPVLKPLLNVANSAQSMIVALLHLL